MSTITKFRQRVYNVVGGIKPGRVMTYGQVAIAAERPRAYRAVGNALNKNYEPKIPCHRVIRSDGKVGGYNRGSRVKLALLKKEGAVK